MAPGSINLITTAFGHGTVCRGKPRHRVRHSPAALARTRSAPRRAAAPLDSPALDRGKRLHRPFDHDRQAPGIDAPAVAVHGQRRAFSERLVTERTAAPFDIDSERGAPDDTRLSHLARHHRRMRRAAAARRHDAGGACQASDVVR